MSDSITINAEDCRRYECRAVPFVQVVTEQSESEPSKLIYRPVPCAGPRCMHWVDSVVNLRHQGGIQRGRCGLSSR